MSRVGTGSVVGCHHIIINGEGGEKASLLFVFGSEVFAFSRRCIWRSRKRVQVTIGDLSRSASLDGIGNPRAEFLVGRVLIAECWLQCWVLKSGLGVDVDVGVLGG